MPENNISIVYITAGLRQAQLAGHDTSALLEAAGITAAQLQDPDARINDQQYISIMMALIWLINDEFLGIGGKRRAPRGSFGMMCHAVIHLPTLKKALLRGIMFYNRLTMDVHLKLQTCGDRAVLSVIWDDPGVDANHAATEATLIIAHRFSCWLINQRIPLIEATFNYAPPDHVDQHHRLFHCPLRFNQPRNSVVFDVRYLNYPLMQNESSLKHFLRTAPFNLFVIPSNAQALTAQIRALLSKDFSHEFPAFEAIASQLNMTPQTLRRRLKEEANSYQAIKDNLRRDAAIYYLSRPQLSVEEIALLMGFSEASTFHRAFKKWTGLTPGEYRQGLNL